MMRLNLNQIVLINYLEKAKNRIDNDIYLVCLCINKQIQFYNLNMKTTKNVPEFDHVQEGVTWVGGPTHELQRQHIPGYMGHVPALFSQNVHGKNFARVTAECLNKKVQPGIDVQKDQRYTSYYKQQFGKPDTRKTQFTTTAENILSDLKKTEHHLNKTLQQEYQKIPKSIQQIKPIDRVPVVGYMGHRPVYRPPLKSYVPPPPPEKVELDQIKKLEQMLGTGNINQKLAREVIEKDVPVVGYGGFMKGIKSENLYGAPFRDLGKKSIYS